jgi:type III secretory pathway component EscV
MKKIMANALILTMLGITLVYYAYTRHGGGNFGASFGGSMLGGMTGSMIGSSMAAKSEPKTVIVQQPAPAAQPQPVIVERPAARAEGLSAEDVQENLDDLRRAFKKDLNTLNDRIDTVVSELRAENKEIKVRLDACEANIKNIQQTLKGPAAQEPVKEQAKASVIEPTKELDQAADKELIQEPVKEE